MSLPHILMLGLLNGASVGIVVSPPATIGELGNYAIDEFYAVDYSNNQRKLSKAEFQFIKGIIRLRQADKLQAHKDYRYYKRLEQSMHKSITKGIKQWVQIQTITPAKPRTKLPATLLSAHGKAARV